MDKKGGENGNEGTGEERCLEGRAGGKENNQNSRGAYTTSDLHSA